MANVMKDVAKALGVELEEEFNIKGTAVKYKLTDQGLCYYDYYAKNWLHSTHSFERLLLGYDEIIKIPKQILTEKEKDYLSSVIKPFRDRIIYIAKKGEDDESEYIEISLRYYVNKFYAVFFLPDFKKGTMYKGMETDKKYMLEELGL